MTQGGGAGDLEIGRAVVYMANKTQRRLANKAPVQVTCVWVAGARNQPLFNFWLLTSPMNGSQWPVSSPTSVHLQVKQTYADHQVSAKSAFIRYRPSAHQSESNSPASETRADSVQLI